MRIFNWHREPRWVRELYRPRPEWGGLNRIELDRLARYNSEVHRGVVHSDEWQAHMREQQRRFDSAGATR